MTFAMNVRIQLIGYVMKIVCGMWNWGIRKTVKSQIILKRQAPRSEEITGISEWPIPRIEFAMPSIMPQRKYVVRIIHMRIIPALITSSLFVKMPRRLVPKNKNIAPKNGCFFISKCP